VITAVQTDSAGRVIGATASVDGLSSQRIYVDHGSNTTVGDILEVVNYGGAAGPAWYSMRRVGTVIPVPTLPYGTSLPTPTALALTTGAYEPVAGGGSAAWIYAAFRTIDPAFGAVGYQCEYRMNDEPDDDPTLVSVLDPKTFTTLVGSISASVTVIPRAATDADFDFAKEGIIQIDSELISYTGATRSPGIWLYPYTLGGTSFTLQDYVEDAFTGTDTTNITAHTPDYDRHSGGWYVIPTYSSNWAISGNKIVAAPGGSWPYSAAIIDAMATTWDRYRMRGDWTIPTTGLFGYIADYADASNFIYILYNATTGAFQIIERISGSENTIWTQAVDKLTSAETYTFEAQVEGKTVHIRVSGGDLTEDIEYTASEVLTNTADQSSFGIWSYEAVTLDNFWLDDARERSLVDDEWIDFVYYAVGFDRVKIADNGYSAVAHSHTFDTDGDPGATGGTIYPAFVGCTRGYGDTDAAIHSSGAGVYAQSLGFMLQPLAGAMDYNVRVRAHLAETVLSPWSAWSTILSASDTIAPSAPTGLTVTSMPGAIEFGWTGPGVDDVPDLAGFNIYSATDGTGTGATLIATLPVALSAVVQVDVGTVAFYNIKALDCSDNLSAYGEASWLRGESLYPLPEQWLTNSDFERDTAVAGDPDEWSIASDGTYALGAYGFGGGRGVRFSLADNDGCDLDWPASETDTSVQHAIEEQLTHIIAIKMKCSDTSWEWHLGDTPPTGVTWIRLSPEFYGGSVNPVGAGDWAMGKGGEVDLGGGWELIWIYTRVYIDTDDFLGFQFDAYNDSGAAITIDLDHAHMHRGITYDDWVPNLARLDGSAGLRMDTAGIVGDSLVMDADGEIYSDLILHSDIVLATGGIKGSTAIGARVYDSANQSIVSGTYTTITFDSERFDTDGIHSVVSNTDRLTAQRDGVYLISATIRFATNSTGIRWVGIRLNGTAYIVIADQNATSGYSTRITLTTLYELSTDDYVDLRVWQNSGGALNVEAVGNYSPEFGMVRMA
jgi:hypothetical protein